MREAREARGAEAVALLAIVLAVAAMSLLRVTGDPLFFWHDDFQTQYLPGLREVARAWSEGSFPLLTTASWHATALAGELQYGVFSLFATLVNLFAWSLGLSLPMTAMVLSTVHLALAAVGAYLLARDFDVSRALAAAVAIVASHNGAVIVWGATDWYPLLASFAWLPWFWLGLRRIERSPRGALAVAGTAFALYSLITAGWPFTMLMALVVAAWHIVPALVRRENAIAMIVACAIGTALAGPALLVHVEYLLATSRTESGLLQHSWRVPLTAFVGAIYPTFRTTWNGWYSLTAHSVIELAGAFVPLTGLIAALALFGRDFIRAHRRELTLLGVVTLAAMLPSVSLFRFSFRWLPLWHLVLAIVGARGIAWMRDRRGEARIDRWNAGAWAVALAVIAWGFCALFDGAWSLTRSYSSLVLVFAVLWMAVEAAPPALKRAAAFFPVIVVFASVWLIFAWVPVNQDVAVWHFEERELRAPAPYDPSTRTFALYRRADVFRGDRLQTHAREGNPLFRPGNTPMLANLRFVNGYSPMGVRGMHDVLGFDYLGYVTDEAAARLLVKETQRGALLDRMGVDAIVVHHALLKNVPRQHLADWDVATMNGGEFLLRRRANTGAPVRGAACIRIERAVEQRLRSSATVDTSRCASDATIYFTRPWLPGWRASINGAGVPLLEVDSLMPAMIVPRGQRAEVAIDYRPRSLTIGIAVAAGGLLALLGFAWLRR